MINITKLYCDQITPGDWLRYGSGGNGELKGRIAPKKACERKPVIVWNITSRCNLKCVHCYNDSGQHTDCQEVTSDKARQVLTDIADFGVPSVLFSGGEPLLRKDLFELISFARDKGLGAVISTNGTLITSEKARQIKECGSSYVGISLDGIGAVNDKFRGVEGAFDRAVAGIRNCMDAGVRVGLRLTLTKRNVQDIEQLFEFLETEGIERACFYHLVPSGRGDSIFNEDLAAGQSIKAMDTILAKTKELKDAGKKTDILTVDNHVDGVYIYLKLLREAPEKARQVWKLLTWNGGGLNSSGVGIGCIDFHGHVHPDQFWGHYSLGSIHEKTFSEIWSNPNEPLLKGLRNRRDYIKGRCRLCKYFDACGGALRVRADLYFDDPWASEPACYLTDEQIGLDDAEKAELEASGESYDMSG